MSGVFQPEKYKDEYYLKVKKAIKQKVSGNEIVEAKQEKQPVKIINLMEALQKSIATGKNDKAKKAL